MPSRVRMTALEVELGMALEEVARFHEDWIAMHKGGLVVMLERAAKVGTHVNKALAFYQTVSKADAEDTDMLREKIKGDVDAERKGWR